MTIAGPADAPWVVSAHEACLKMSFAALTIPAFLEALLSAPAALAGLMGPVPPSLSPGVPPWLRGAFLSARQRLVAMAGAANPSAGDAVTVQTFALIRSLVILVDADRAGADDLGPAFYAAQLGIPLWVVSDRIAVSPWLLAHGDLVVRPSGVANLLEVALRG